MNSAAWASFVSAGALGDIDRDDDPPIQHHHPEKLRTIIAGSRTARREFVEAALESCPWSDRIVTVLSGTAKGADSYGEDWAEHKNILVERFPANWKAHGKQAGFIRNRLMAQRADALIAVWDSKSKGTQNMINEAHRAGLLVFIYRF